MLVMFWLYQRVVVSLDDSAYWRATSYCGSTASFLKRSGRRQQSRWSKNFRQKRHAVVLTGRHNTKVVPTYRHAPVDAALGQEDNPQSS